MERVVLPVASVVAPTSGESLDHGFPGALLAGTTGPTRTYHRHRHNDLEGDDASRRNHRVGWRGATA